MSRDEMRCQIAREIIPLQARVPHECWVTFKTVINRLTDENIPIVEMKRGKIDGETSENIKARKRSENIHHREH